MRTCAQPEAVPGFLEALMGAFPKLKKRLQQQYEQVYPELREIIQYVIDEEVSNAWSMCPQFPHLVLPDLVEAHIRQLGLQPIFFESDKALAPSALPEPRELPDRALEQVYVSLTLEAVPTC